MTSRPTSSCSRRAEIPMMKKFVRPSSRFRTGSGRRRVAPCQIHLPHLQLQATTEAKGIWGAKNSHRSRRGKRPTPRQAHHRAVPLKRVERPVSKDGYRSSYRPVETHSTTAATSSSSTDVGSTYMIELATDRSGFASSPAECSPRQPSSKAGWRNGRGMLRKFYCGLPDRHDQARKLLCDLKGQRAPIPFLAHPSTLSRQVSDCTSWKEGSPVQWRLASRRGSSANGLGGLMVDAVTPETRAKCQQDGESVTLARRTCEQFLP
jgi:hypothetical protein